MLPGRAPSPPPAAEPPGKTARVQPSTPAGAPTDDGAARQAAQDRAAQERAAQERAAQERAARERATQDRQSQEQKSTIVPLPDPGPDPEEAPATRAEPSRTATANADQVERFVRNYDGGECFFVTAVSAQPPNVTVDAYGVSPRPFMTFDAAFQNGLGFEPHITLHQVTDAQCPLVEFLARQFPLRDARAATLAVTSDLLHSGEELSGTVETGADRSIELLLVSDDGRVSNLSRSLRRNGDTARFTLKLEGSGVPKPQLLLALTSQKPLSSLRGGGTARAGQILRQIGDELDRDPRPAGIAIGYFKLGS
jgi:serine/threonine-protein kinase